VRDIWDVEYEKLDRVIGVSTAIGAVLSLLAAYAGWGWWSVVVFVVVCLLGALVVHRTEQEFIRIRSEMGVVSDEEGTDPGWSSKREAKNQFAKMPPSWRETRRVIRYFDKDGHERWGVRDKPRYWPNRRGQERHLSTSQEVTVDDVRRKLIERAE